MPPEITAPVSSPQPVNPPTSLHTLVLPATEFTFSLRCIYCIAGEYHTREHHDILRRAVPPTDWFSIYEELAKECDLAFMAYQLAKSEHPEPDWSPVTGPLMKAWSESQAALFLMEGL